MIILKTKLRNAINKCDSSYIVNLSNIAINGERRGCSGFITNPTNGVVIYINTEKSCMYPLSERNLYRYAKDDHDFGGAHSYNMWASDTELVLAVHKALQDKKAYDKWCKKGGF